MLRKSEEMAAEAPAPASDAIDHARAAEIAGRRWDDDRSLKKFMEVVVLPLAICLALVMVLRRGVFK